MRSSNHFHDFWHTPPLLPGGRRERLDHLIAARLERGEGQRLLKERRGWWILSHPFLIFHCSPLRVHRDLPPIEAPMQAGGHETARMAHGSFGHVGEQIHEPLLVSGVTVKTLIKVTSFRSFEMTVIGFSSMRMPS